MPFYSGERLGHFEIVSPIGKGGMGEVWKARDTRLNRDVAIKSSKAGFSGRFQKEAEAIAALNHPNICTLHDVGQDYLVMEYIEGPTLAERIDRGAVPVGEALAIAAQIAAALEAAHEKSIIHRDLKPANIKVRPDGSVKVLDFGLAKAASESNEFTPDSPTALSAAGLILGTAGYMSPEQARGTQVDKRTDVWSFGVVLFEMLAGQSAFHGDTVSDKIASVLRSDPDWKALPSATPPGIRRLLRRCLERDRNRRLRDIGDARLEIEDALAGVGEPDRPAASPRGSRTIWWAACAAAAAAGALAAAFWMMRGKPAESVVTRLVIPPPEKAELGGALGGVIAISPDGRRVGFLARTGPGRGQIYIRSLDEPAPQAISGTQGARSIVWAQDSKSIAFATGREWRLLDLAGGESRIICTMSGAAGGGGGGGSLNRNNVLLFPQAGAIYQVESLGAVPSPVTTVDTDKGELLHTSPQFLPDGRHFLFVAAGQRHEDSALFVASLGSKERTLLAHMDSNFVFVPRRAGSDQGYVVYGRQSTLMALPFDAASRKITGAAVRVMEGVDFANSAPGTMHYTDFSIAASGSVLAYSALRNRNSQLVWYDHAGRNLANVGPAAVFNNVNLSADGKRIAIDAVETEGNGPVLAPTNILVIDAERGTSLRASFERATNWFPCFSPDGSRLVFTSNQQGRPHLYMKSSSGAGSDERLIQQSTGDDWCGSWSPDGHALAYYHRSRRGDWDIWILPLEGERKPFPLLQSPFDEAQPRFSPDGKWLAYSSDESGTPQVYVQPYSPANPASGKWTISLEAAADPEWRRDGKELYYLTADGKLMGAAINIAGNRLEAGVPRLLFQTPARGMQIFSHYAASPDGRFVVATPPDQRIVVPITVAVNWMTGIK